MAASSSAIARLRRMVNEPDETAYTDVALAEYIERFPLIDERGIRPYWWDPSTTPPTKTETTGWIPTYDLNAAAAEIWEEKANILAQDYDFAADKADYKRSQAYEQAMKQARRYASKRNPGSITLTMEPRVESQPGDMLWIGNLAETDT